VTGPRLLLGAFILGQLAFLVVINFLELIKSARDELPKDYAKAIDRVVPGWPSKQGHFHDLADVADRLTRRYAQLTGQTQGWSLFAPDVGKQCVFPAVLVRWDEDPLSAPALTRLLTPLAATTPLEASALRAACSAGRPAAVPPAPVTILSDNEPRDVNRYFRLGRFRLRRLESNLVLVLRQTKDETPAEAAERWRGRIYKLLDEDGDVVKAYLRWRWGSYRKTHTGTPEPARLILVMRRWAIRPPEKAPPYWDGPFTMPVARLHGDLSRAPLEMYNPVTRRFQEVKP
jgi:hypothetical protein